MDDAKSQIHIHGSVQGLTIGDHASGNAHFSPSTSSNILTATSSYRSILGTPPLTDPSVIQQRTTLVETITARLTPPNLNDNADDAATDIADVITAKLTQPNFNALVLTGIGGVGKSTLAALVYHVVEAQCLQRTSPFAIPPLWLAIDASTTFIDIMGTIYQALAKPLPDIKSLSPTNQAQALCTLLRAAPSQLIVLDQFDEYLLDWRTGEVLPDHPGIAEWLDALNSQRWRSGCRLLFTSRPKPKGTRTYADLGLQEYPVEGLTLGEGMNLLRKGGLHAQEVDLRKAIVSCNGHALALTLLVPLVKDYAIPLTDLLADPALWISGGDLTNLLDAIFQHLSDIQRDLLRAFSVYRTAVPIEAVQAAFLGVSQQSIFAALRTLLTQHLIQAPLEKSYQLHAIVASYVKEHFVEDDEQENLLACQQAHARAAAYCIQWAHYLHPDRKKRKSVSDVFWVIEAAWQSMQAAQWQKAYTLTVQEELLVDLGRWGSYMLLLEMSQAFLSQKVWLLAPDQRAFVSNWLGRAYDRLGKKQEALDCYEQALAIYREVGDRSGEGTILNNVGIVYDALGKKQEALGYYEQALTIHKEVGNRAVEGTTLNNLGAVYGALGKKQEALDYYEQALTIHKEVGNRSMEGTTLNNLGAVYDALGKKQEALEYYEQALAIGREVRDRSLEGVILWNLGALFFSQRYYEPALAAFLLARHIFEEVSSPHQNVVQSWIDALHKEIGKKPFTALHMHVESHAEQILESEMIKRAFGNPKERAFLSYEEK